MHKPKRLTRADEKHAPVQWNYEELLAYVEQRTATAEELGKHFGRLADIYDDMAKAQSKLVQRWYTAVPAFIDGELGSTAANALNGVVTAESTAQRCYRDFAGGVQQRVVRLLGDFVASAAALHKRLHADYQHLWKQYAEASAGVAKCRARYAKACAAREKRDDGGASVEATEQQYRQCVASCNRMQAALFQHTLDGCHVLDDLLQRRDRVLETSLRTVAALAETVLPHEAVADLVRSAQSICTPADLDLFAAVSELCCHPPHRFFFESCTPGHAPPPATTATATGTTATGTGTTTTTSNILPAEWKPTEIALLRMPVEGLVVMQQLFGRSGPSTLPYGLKWLLDTLVDACAHEPAESARDVCLQAVPPAELAELAEAFGRGDYAAPRSAAAACELAKVFLCSLPEALVPAALAERILQDAAAPRDALAAVPEPQRATLGCFLAALQAVARTPGNSAASVADGFALRFVRTPQWRRDTPTLRRMAVAARRWLVRMLTEVDYTQYRQLLAGDATGAAPTAALPAAPPGAPLSAAGLPPTAWTKIAPSRQRAEHGDSAIGAGWRACAGTSATEDSAPRPAAPPPPPPQRPMAAPRRPPPPAPQAQPPLPSRAPPPPPPARPRPVHAPPTEE